MKKVVFLLLFFLSACQAGNALTPIKEAMRSADYQEVSADVTATATYVSETLEGSPYYYYRLVILPQVTMNEVAVMVLFISELTTKSNNNYPHRGIVDEKLTLSPNCTGSCFKGLELFLLSDNLETALLVYLSYNSTTLYLKVAITPF